MCSLVDHVFSRSRFFVRDINFHECFKGHGQVCRLLKKELPLPRQSILLGGKPSFQLLLLHTLPVKEEYLEWKLNWPQTADGCGRYEPKKKWRKE